jgi:hypothetical protein
MLGLTLRRIVGLTGPRGNSTPQGELYGPTLSALVFCCPAPPVLRVAAGQLRRYPSEGRTLGGAVC